MKHGPNNLVLTVDIMLQIQAPTNMCNLFETLTLRYAWKTYTYGGLVLYVQEEWGNSESFTSSLFYCQEVRSIVFSRFGVHYA